MDINLTHDEMKLLKKLVSNARDIIVSTQYSYSSERILIDNMLKKLKEAK